MRINLMLAASPLLWLAPARAAAPVMPTFFARYEYPAPAQNGTYVQVADTNGDRVADLIVLQIPETLDSTPVSVHVLIGNGGGTFRSGPTTTLANIGAESFAAADLNADGKVDLAMIGYYLNQSQLGVFTSRGNGDGSFQRPVFYPINDGLLSSVVVGDFNGDGIPDIVTAGSAGVWLLTGKGNGTFHPAAHVAGLPLGSSFRLAAADFNQDHKLDLVVSLSNAIESGKGFVVFMGNGDGSFQAPQIFTRPPGVNALAVGTLTRGGAPSIVMATALTGYVDIYFGDGTGGFQGPFAVSMSNLLPNTSVAIGDLNGDGIPDIITGAGEIVYGKGDGTFSQPINHPTSGGNVVLADLRGNGRTDIVTGGGLVSVGLSEGQGAFEDGVWTAVTGATGCAAAADFNGDGKPDLAMGTTEGITILFGTGVAATPFTAGTSIPLTTYMCPFAGDLNGDQIPDLLLTGGQTVEAYLGNGDGTFSYASAIPNSAAATVTLADFNQDGKLDFASGNSLFLGNGDGTFQPAVPIMANPPGGFLGEVAGDINHDGWPDLVLNNLSSPADSNVYVLLNNRQGGFTPVAANLEQNAYPDVLADLNGDGNPDLILIGPDGASVYLGHGTGGFTFEQTLAPAGAGSVMVADVTGDGIPDILVAGYSFVAVYAGKGDGTYRGPRYFGTGPMGGTPLVENLQGQSPIGGLPDIVSPDASGGVRVLINLTQ